MKGQALLFVKKMKQKNFDLRGALALTLPQRLFSERSLVLFFKKEPKTLLT
jgi:hypothetical protein